MNHAVLIYPHQLFEDNPLLFKKDLQIFLVEEPLMFTQYAFHKQKLMFHRATMQQYKKYLLLRGYRVHYVDFSTLKKTEDIALLLAAHNIASVSFCDIVDNWLHSKLTKALTKSLITYTIVHTPLFITSQNDLDSFFHPLIQKHKKFQMKTFYEWQRKRLNVLLETDGAPTGGKWSFDEDNRKKIPKNESLPEEPTPNTSEAVKEAHQYIDTYFKNNYGSVQDFFYPVEFETAKKWFASFLKHKLSSFGPYEDAITTRGNILFHSVLSPLLNVGLLTPNYVLEQTLSYAQKNDVPLSSLEGFIRQLIGWREYMRAVYVYLGSKARKANYFKSHRALPESFWQGNTGIIPVDDTIKTVLQYAYSHHIPRLMIMGNFMNLCKFKPDDVYRWFMEMYIDAYDWVMVPNVYSMALFADGGLITTKPYISGSAYILKMSNYKKGEWSEIWDSLFWHFVGTHFQLLSSHSRLGFIGITYQKMSQAKKDAHRATAMKFLKSLNSA